MHILIMLKKFDKITLIVLFYTFLNNIVNGELRFEEGVERVVGFDGHGDMLFPTIIDSHGRSKLYKDSQLWTSKNGILYFYSAAHYSPREICMIKKAVEMIATFACFPVRAFQISKRCAARKDILHCLFEYLQSGDDVDAYEQMMEAGISDDIRNSIDYVFMYKRNMGCQAFVGRLGGKQPMSLDAKCFYMDGGTIVHEMLHTLGYTHEHTRFDRDQFIKIIFNNIKHDRRSNFNKKDHSIYRDFGRYRYDSLMHYGNTTFSKDPSKLATIQAKKPIGDLPLGQRTMLTIHDAIKIRSVTRCPGKNFREHLNLLLASKKMNVQRKPLEIYTSCL